MIYYQNSIKRQIIIVNSIVTSEMIFDSGCSKENNGKFIVESTNAVMSLNDKKLDYRNSSSFIDNLIESSIILNDLCMSQKLNISAVFSLENKEIVIEKEGNIHEDSCNNGICRILISNDEENKIYNFNIDRQLQNKINDLTKEIKYIKSKNNELERKAKKFFVSNVPVIFLGGSGGYYIHEVLGHLVESDYIANHYSVIGNNHRIGDLIASQILNVSDDPEACKNIIDLGSIDDEGEKMSNIDIIKNGEFNGLLCNKKDSIKYGEKFNGCARRQSYQFKSIPRMRNTFIRPYENGRNESQILENIDNQIAINQVYSGYVNPTTGKFQLQGEGFSIKKGMIQNKIKKLIISGDLLNSLKNIVEIGSDFFSYPVYCSKFYQTIPVCVGSPTIVVENLNVTGEIYE